MRAMGFWPFGREPADVESASRVVTAQTRDNRRVRAKLTLHFREPQTQADADIAADRCAHLTELVFQEVPGHEHLLGHEEGLVATLLGRLPPGLPALRGLDLAAVHVLGDPGSNLRRHASTLPPPGAIGDVRLPMAAPLPSAATPHPPSTAYPPPSVSYPQASAGPPSAGPPSAGPRSAIPPSAIPPSASYPPGSSSQPPISGGHAAAPVSHRPGPASVSPRRRSISSSLRAVTPSIVPPRGSSTTEIGAALSPLLRDAATRLLLGFLRINDLVAVRKVPLDEAATELLAQLLPVSEAPPGEFEASRTLEVARWSGTLGPAVMDALRSEAATLAALLARAALAQVGLIPSIAQEILESLCHTAFPAAEGRLGAAAAVALASEEELTAEAAHTMARILGHPDAGPLQAALTPLLSSVADDSMLIAQMAKLSLGLPV